MTWEHERGYGSVVAASAVYMAQHPDVVIEWEQRSLLAFGDQPLEELSPHYDFVVADHPHVPHAAAAGLLLALDGRGRDAELEESARNSVGLSHESYAYAGRQWGLATDAAGHVSAHRPDLLADPPRDWNEVMELLRGGRVLWPLKPVDAFSSLVTLACTHGGRVLGRGAGEAPGPAHTGFGTREHLELALDLLHRAVDLMPREALGLNPIGVADALVDTDDFVYAPLLFGYTNYSREGYRRRRIAYRDAPRGLQGQAPVGLLAGAGIVVSSTTEHPDASVDFALWLDSAQTQEGAYFDGGGQPGHAAAWDSPRTNAQSLDFFVGTRASLENAYLRPRHPAYPQLQFDASMALHAALRGEMSDAALLAELDRLAERFEETVQEGSAA